MLLNEMLPGGNTLPTRNYDAKKILCSMGMEYKRIHACPSVGRHGTSRKEIVKIVVK